MFAAVEDDDFIFLFGGDTGDDVTCTQRSFQFLVREQIELLLYFSLYVFSAAGTQDIDQTGLIDIAVDDLST